MPGLFDFHVWRICTALGNTPVRHCKKKATNKPQLLNISPWSVHKPREAFTTKPRFHVSRKVCDIITHKCYFDLIKKSWLYLFRKITFQGEFIPRICLRWKSQNMSNNQKQETISFSLVRKYSFYWFLSSTSVSITIPLTRDGPSGTRNKEYKKLDAR